MPSNITEIKYCPHGWVLGLSGVLFCFSLSLWSLPSFDRWIMTRQPAAISQFQGQNNNELANLLLERDLQSYQLWLEKEPNSEIALRGVLDTTLKLNDLERAAEALERLAGVYGDNPDYRVLLAQIKQQNADFEGAAAIYNAILLQDPSHINSLQGMVDLLLLKNRSEGAIELLQTTLRDLGTLSEAETISVDLSKVTSIQLMLGQVYLAQERVADAIAMYEQAATVNKSDFRPILAKALILKDQGDAASAKPYFLSAINLAPARYKDQVIEMAVLSDADLEALSHLAPQTPTASDGSDLVSPD